MRLIFHVLVFYTGTSGDPVPIVKGWLRASLRTIDASHPQHAPFAPHRNYRSTDVQKVVLDEVYTFDVEIWPTSVVIGKGGVLLLEIASCDTQGAGFFEHTHPLDRAVEKLKGWNNLHLGGVYENYLTVPVIPERNAQ